MPDDLKTRLKIAKSKYKNKNQSDKGNEKSSFGRAFQLSTELVSAVLVATIIGFILDNWFDTKPWLILIFFFRRCDCWNNERYQICKEYAKINLEIYILWQQIQCTNLMFIELVLK